MDPKIGISVDPLIFFSDAISGINKMKVGCLM